MGWIHTEIKSCALLSRFSILLLYVFVQTVHGLGYFIKMICWENDIIHTCVTREWSVTDITIKLCTHPRPHSHVYKVQVRTLPLLYVCMLTNQWRHKASSTPRCLCHYHDKDIYCNNHSVSHLPLLWLSTGWLVAYTSIVLVCHCGVGLVTPADDVIVIWLWLRTELGAGNFSKCSRAQL